MDAPSWWPLACLAAAIGGLAWLAAAHAAWRRTAAWLALALVGHAAALRTIDAGPLVRYQHYRPPGVLLAADPWLVVVIGLQAALAAVALISHARQGRWGGLERIPTGRLAAALLVSGLTAAALSADTLRYVAELAFAFGLQLVTIATLLAAVLAMPQASLASTARWFGRVLGEEDDRQERERARRDRFGWVAAGAAAALAATLSVVAYERHPHVPDEVAYLLHARYFAEGRLTMPAPPIPAAFDLDLMHYEPDHWFSPVPPGWPAVLAAGVLVGLPWLVNPLLAGAGVRLAYALLVRLYPLRQARWATALLASSPWLAFLGMSFLTHVLTLVCALAAALAILQARHTDRFAWGAVAGAAVGATALVRPLDGLITGTLISAWALGLGGRRLAPAALGGLLAGTLAAGSLMLPYNFALTGSPFTLPIDAYVAKYHAPNANAYGFGPDRGLGWAIDPNPGHGPFDAMVNAGLNAFGLGTDLFGWGSGSLLFAALLVCLGRMNRTDRLMAAAVAIVFVAHFFYYFSGGPDFGARYWFLMIVPLAALTARGIQIVERAADARAGIFVAALVVMALVNYVPWRAADKYRHFRGMRPEIRTLVPAQPFDGDLVLVAGERFPDYAAAAVYNPVDLSSRATVFAWDRDAHVRASVLQTYAGRRIWLVDGPSITGAGYRVARGPIAAETLLADRPR